MVLSGHAEICNSTINLLLVGYARLGNIQQSTSGQEHSSTEKEEEEEDAKTVTTPRPCRIPCSSYWIATIHISSGRTHRGSQYNSIGRVIQSTSWVAVASPFWTSWYVQILIVIRVDHNHKANLNKL